MKENVGVAFYSSESPLITLPPASLRCIAILAGESTRQFILSHLFTVGNAMVLEYGARSKFDKLLWAVEPAENVSTETLMFAVG
jgi:hypothetical protein